MNEPPVDTICKSTSPIPHSLTAENPPFFSRLFSPSLSLGEDLWFLVFDRLSTVEWSRLSQVCKVRIFFFSLFFFSSLFFLFAFLTGQRQAFRGMLTREKFWIRHAKSVGADVGSAWCTVREQVLFERQCEERMEGSGLFHRPLCVARRVEQHVVRVLMANLRTDAHVPFLFESRGWGKSALVMAFCAAAYEELYERTDDVPDIYSTLRNVDCRLMAFHVQDAGGSQVEREVQWARWLMGVDGVIVCDLFNSERVMEALDTFALMARSTTRDGSLPPMVLCRTKCDLELPFPQRRAVLQWCRENGVPFVSTSARKGINVHLAFETLARLVAQ